MSPESRLQKDKHIKYWVRCLKTFLPYQYTPNDSSRMTLAFFTISALDLLDSLRSRTTEQERQDYIDWIYNCQHPEGGFRGFPGTDLGDLRNESNKHWDPANIPATYFALASLVILGDDLSRVSRAACLRWLGKMQRPDGSFGETLGENDDIEGGMDTRYGYCASCVRWMLRGTYSGDYDGVKDIDVDKLVKCIRESETYDGGISEAAYHEAHAGFTYCAISALAVLNRLPEGYTTPLHPAPEDASTLKGLTNMDLTIHWLVSRQTATLDEEDAFDTNSDETDTPATCHDAHSFVTVQNFPSIGGEESYKDRPTSHFDLQWIGFNGRINKVADTCYGWWVSGSLGVLDKLSLVDTKPFKRYLLEKTQSIVGGFGKIPNDPPDLYHSYLGLACLAQLDPDLGLKAIDPAICISQDAVRHLESIPWRQELNREKPKCANGGAANEYGAETAPVETTKDFSYIAMTGG